MLQSTSRRIHCIKTGVMTGDVFVNKFDKPDSMTVIIFIASLSYYMMQHIDFHVWHLPFRVLLRLWYWWCNKELMDPSIDLYAVWSYDILAHTPWYLIRITTSSCGILHFDSDIVLTYILYLFRMEKLKRYSTCEPCTLELSQVQTAISKQCIWHGSIYTLLPTSICDVDFFIPDTAHRVD